MGEEGEEAVGMAGRIGLSSAIYDDIDHHCGFPIQRIIHTATQQRLGRDLHGHCTGKRPKLFTNCQRSLTVPSQNLCWTLESHKTPVPWRDYVHIISLLYSEMVLPAGLSGVSSITCYEGVFTEVDPAQTSREQNHRRG